MKVIDFIQDIDLSTINTVSDLLSSIYDAIQIPVAIFDDMGQLLYAYDGAHNCKCFYSKFKKESSYCSLLIPVFTGNIIRKIVTDKLCDHGARITTKFVTIRDNFLVLSLFQFVLDTDNYDNNTSPDLVATAATSNINIRWSPTVITSEKREALFDFIVDVLLKINLNDSSGFRV